MSSIDLKVVLQRTVSRGYGDLVTRRTGQAVRFGVEEHLAAYGDGEVAVIDFSGVRCLDFSCADEIVGKLLLTHGRLRYFLLRGVSEGQAVAIEQILERYELAVVGEDRSGQMRVLGNISEPVRKTFHLVVERGDAGVDDVVGRLEVSHDAARDALDQLVQLRLAMEGRAANRVASLA